MSNWEVKKLSDVCTVISGQSPKSTYYNKEKEGLPFYQGKKEFTNKFIGEAPVYTSYITKIALPNDILMSVRAPVGPINYAVEKCCIGRGLASIRVNDDVVSDFIYYFLLSLQDVIKGHAGTTFNSISKTEIENLEILLPTLEEQKSIVSKLDKIFDILETLEQNVLRGLDIIDSFFKSYLNSTFNDNVEDWHEELLEHLCDISIGKTPSRGNKKYWDINLETDNTWLSIADMDNKVDKKVFSSKEHISNEGAKICKITKSGTLLLSFKLSIGKVAFAGKDLYTNEAIARLPIREDIVNLIDKNFLYYYLSNFDYETILKGDIKVKGKTLNKDKLKSIPILFPTIEKQNQIVKKIENVEENINKIKSKYQRQLEIIKKLKKNILKDYLSNNSERR